MIANYHTHTFRCKHAYEEERQYVENAIEGGLKILGFADHSPQVYPEGFVSPIRMTPEELPDYIRAISALKKKYEGKIEIRCGLEAEYYPALFPRLLELLQEHPGVEYLILGQHFADNEVGFHQYARSWEGDQEYKIAKYVDEVIGGIETGKFLYVAHPDVCLYEGADLAPYRKHMRRLCQAANARKMPVEINAQGPRFTGFYPFAPFWEVAAEEGCVAIYGSDAHRPQFTCDPAANAKMEAVAKACGIRVIDTVEIKKEDWK